MAIWGIIRREVDGWAIRNENANLGEFEGQKSGTKNKVENGAG